MIARFEAVRLARRRLADKVLHVAVTVTANVVRVLAPGHGYVWPAVEAQRTLARLHCALDAPLVRALGRPVPRGGRVFVARVDSERMGPFATFREADDALRSRLRRSKPNAGPRSPAKKAELARRLQAEADARQLVAAKADLADDPMWEFEHDPGRNTVVAHATSWSGRRFWELIGRDRDGAYLVGTGAIFRWEPDGRRPLTGSLYRSGR